MKWLVTLRFGALKINGAADCLAFLAKCGLLKPSLKNQFAIFLNYPGF